MPFTSAYSISAEGLLALAMIALVMALHRRMRRRASATKGVDLRESEGHLGVITIAPGTKFRVSRLCRPAELQDSFSD